MQKLDDLELEGVTAGNEVSDLAWQVLGIKLKDYCQQEEHQDSKLVQLGRKLFGLNI